MTTNTSLSFILSEIGSAMDALMELGLKKADALSIVSADSKHLKPAGGSSGSAR